MKLWFECGAWASKKGRRKTAMLNLIGCKTDYPPDFHIAVEPVPQSRPCVICFTSTSTLSRCRPEESCIELLSGNPA